MQLSTINLSLTKAYGGGGSQAWSPLSLFSSGEQGAWYDPSDFSTMFQDSTGSTPVTAVGQPVGLILDKSRGLALGPELVANGSFDSGITGWTVNYGNASVVGGELVLSESSGSVSVSQTLTGLISGKWYKVSLRCKSSGGADADSRVVISGTVVLRPTNTSMNSLVAYFLGTVSTTLELSSVRGNSSYSFTVDDISIVSVAGNHASQATSASRPQLQQDGNGKYYLDFDGVDDSLATAAIDFTVTSNVAATLGLHKNSDALVGSIFGIGDVDVSSNCLYIRGPGDNNTPTYRIGMKGAAWAEVNGGVATAPVTNVITDIAQCATPRQELRINAVSSVVNTDNPSMAAFGNLPIYICQMGSGTQYFPGRIYSIIVRGAASTAQEITDTETWVNSKTGAF